MTKVKSLRYGRDKRSLDTIYNSEAMFLKDDGTTFFVSTSNLMDSILIYVSEVSLYDIQMNILNHDTDYDKENNKLNKYSIEKYDVIIDELDEVYDSVYKNEILFVLKANSYITSCNEDEWMLPEDYIEEYKDVDIDTLDLESEIALEMM